MTNGHSRELTEAELSAVRNAVLASPALQDAQSKWLADINIRLAPILSNFRRESAIAMAPFNDDIQRHLAEVARMSVAQLSDITRVMAPFQELMQRHSVETIKKLVPIAETLHRQMAGAALPLSADIQRQLTELAAFTIQVLPVPLDESQSPLAVSIAQSRTPEQLIAYITLWIQILGVMVAVLGVVQACLNLSATQDQPPPHGGTNQFVFNNSPTHVTNITTVVQPPPEPAATDTPAPTP